MTDPLQPGIWALPTRSLYPFADSLLLLLSTQQLRAQRTILTVMKRSCSPLLAAAK